MGKMGKEKSPSHDKERRKEKKKSKHLLEEEQENQTEQEEIPLLDASTDSASDLDSVESSSESEEDEDAALVTAETEAEILRTVAMLRAKDPRIYQKDLQLYDDAKLEKAGEAWKTHIEAKASKPNPLTLRAIYQNNLLAGKAEADMTIGEDRVYAPLNQSFDEGEFKNEFKNAFAEDEQEDDLLVLKEKSSEALEQENRQYKEFLYQSLSTDQVTSQTAEDWFSLKEEMNEEDKFLINYVLNRGWIDKKAASKDSLDVSMDEDEQELEKTDEFEFQHNFRFEAGAEAAIIPSYPRIVEDSVRTATNSKRKRQREAKKLRKQQEKDALGEQLKREKNALKKAHRMKQLESELDQELEEEYYQKNFEDVIEGMPTRFHYIPVKKTSFGLSTMEILMADDDLLSKHVPFKCLAPFVTQPELDEMEEKYSAKRRVYKFRDLLQRSFEEQSQLQEPSAGYEQEEHEQ